MLSRAAERMYWAGRYLERAENTARLVRVHGYMLLDLPPEAGRTWGQLITILGCEEAFDAAFDSADETNVVQFLVADAGHPGSILSSLSWLRENIRTSRDIVPTEGWECVNELMLFARRTLPRMAAERNRHRTLSEVTARCQQLTGLLAGTMSHGPGYHFLRLGRNIERADMTTRVLDVPAASLLNLAGDLDPYRFTLWMNVLKSLSGYQMYCQYVRRRVVGEDVIRFLLRDEQFPRSFRHSLTEMRSALMELPRHEAAIGELDSLDDELLATDTAGMEPGPLHDYLDRLQRHLADVHQHVARTWFLPSVEQ